MTFHKDVCSPFYRGKAEGVKGGSLFLKLPDGKAPLNSRHMVLNSTVPVPYVTTADIWPTKGP